MWLKERFEKFLRHIQSLHPWANRRKSRTVDRGVLREFVYLDEVSVYSLLSSRFGPPPSELTETTSRSMKKVRSRTLGAKLSVLNGGRARLEERIDGSTTQVVRKAIIQTTFGDLLSLERDSLLMRSSSVTAQSRKLPADSSELLAGLRQSRWGSDAISEIQLSRGRLLELDVDLEAESVYKVTSALGAFMEVFEQSESLRATAGNLAELEAISRVLDRLLAGLIPVKGTACNWFTVENQNERWITKRSLLTFCSSSPEVRIAPLLVVGTAESKLFWKDVRTVLFAGSTFSVMGRIGRSGLQDTWNPVKLANVLGSISPELTAQFTEFNNLIEDLADPTRQHRGVSQEDMGRAEMISLLTKYASDLSEAAKVAVGREQLANIARAVVTRLDTRVDSSTQERKQACDAVQHDLRDDFACEVDSSESARLRAPILAPYELTQAKRDGPTQMGGSNNREIGCILEVELVGIYW